MKRTFPLFALLTLTFTSSAAHAQGLLMCTHQKYQESIEDMIDLRAKTDIILGDLVSQSEGMIAGPPAPAEMVEQWKARLLSKHFNGHLIRLSKELPVDRPGQDSMNGLLESLGRQGLAAEREKLLIAQANDRHNQAFLSAIDMVVLQEESKRDGFFQKFDRDQELPRNMNAVHAAVLSLTLQMRGLVTPLFNSSIDDQREACGIADRTTSSPSRQVTGAAAKPADTGSTIESTNRDGLATGNAR